MPASALVRLSVAAPSEMTPPTTLLNPVVAPWSVRVFTPASPLRMAPLRIKAAVPSLSIVPPPVKPSKLMSRFVVPAVPAAAMRRVPALVAFPSRMMAFSPVGAPSELVVPALATLLITSVPAWT